MILSFREGYSLRVSIILLNLFLSFLFLIIDKPVGLLNFLASMFFFLLAISTAVYQTKLEFRYGDKGIEFRTYFSLYGLKYGNWKILGDPNRVLLSHFKVQNTYSYGKSINTYSAKVYTSKVYLKYSTNKKSALIYEGNNQKTAFEIADKISKWINLPLKEIDKA